jgi:hypothetical protein
MVKQIPFVALIGLLFVGAVQELLASPTNRIDSLVQVKPLSKAKVPFDLRTFPYVMLEMEFNSSKFIKDFRHLLQDEPSKVEEIILVWTAYRMSETFSQPGLNSKRLEQFGSIYPRLFGANKIKWKFLVQTGATTDETAKTFYHGFLVKMHNENKISRSLTEDREILKKLLELEVDKDSVIGFTSKIRCKKVPTGKYLPRSKRKLEKGILYDHASIWKRKKEKYKKCDTLIVPEVYKHKSIDVYSPIYTGRDSTVSSVFNRHPEWQKILVVCDATGSMSPYYADLVMWIKLNAERRDLLGFTFFNDGDKKPDHDKVIGSTGGIYHSKSNSPTDAVQTLNNTTKAGSGGDQPENNIEALEAAMKKFKDSESIILIGDSYAPVKDIVLLKNISKTVHVVVCGDAQYIHPDYLEIAFKTGGSIHRLNDELDFSKITDNKAIIFGGIEYEIKQKQLLVSKYW